MKHLVLFSILLISSFGLTAQTSNYKDMRPPLNLKLAVSDSTFYESSIASSRYINGPNVLQIYPGETVYIEVELADDSIKSFRSVSEIKHPGKTLEIQFTQNVVNKKHEGMMLKIKNPFNRDLTYEAGMFRMNDSKWIGTTVLPVSANLSSYETWPDVIVTLALIKWSFSKKL
ncbi:hypothetical protein CJD36_018525 [Flavipsychrobacter stenotrophus]|uniref:Carbohydrate-binding domain-containing protein n=1 Tax=Flavipsychrobacter stenotrophus TaxID=2077091 RepID=A0A2S7SRR9_9BACT|nr:hypothetical protein [Flavipsychrobacter stenotrophus]PQJ09246.1 hypothetical protein CJD36_018525 [Flavipsychrobacter stenotrophus]